MDQNCKQFCDYAVRKELVKSNWNCPKKVDSESVFGIIYIFESLTLNSPTKAGLKSASRQHCRSPGSGERPTNGSEEGRFLANLFFHTTFGARIRWD